MSASGSQNTSLGFLTVVASDEHGLFGGYLVLNGIGRPLEFHCTAPVKPNRAQEILFGNTLEPYLYGEQIAQTLFSKSKQKPAFVCTDQEAVMAMRPYITTPMILVAPTDSADSVEEPGGRAYRVDASHQTPPPSAGLARRFTLASQTVRVPDEHADDQALVCAAWETCSQSMDLAEPFARIREAIDEAQRGKRS